MTFRFWCSPILGALGLLLGGGAVVLLIVGFVSTYFAFRYMPYKVYTAPLLTVLVTTPSRASRSVNSNDSLWVGTRSREPRNVATVAEPAVATGLSVARS